MTSLGVCGIVRSATRSIYHRLELGITMEAQCKKKNIYDVQTRQLFVQVLGNGSDSSSRGLVIMTDNKRYLFNCGESTQRDFQQYSSKLLNTERIFLTRASWQNLGGLSATLLMIDRAHTSRDKGVTIYGPQNMQYLLSCLQNFVKLKYSDVSLEYSKEGVIYVDRSLAIRCVHLRKGNQGDVPRVSEELEKLATENRGTSDVRSNCKRKMPTDEAVEENLKRQKMLIESQAKTRTIDVFCYFCDMHDMPGKLLMTKCMEKGVPAGPLLRRLKSGEDVTLEDGTIVLSKDVCLPASPGEAIMILECPTEEYIDSLINHPTIEKYKTGTAEKKLFGVFHFTPEEVLQNARYQAWMKQFKTGTHHIILNENNKRSVMDASRKLQYQLNLLQPEMFPLFHEESQDSDGVSEENDQYFHRAAPQTKIRIQPTYEFASVQPECDPQSYISEAMAVEGFPEALEQVKSKLEGLESSVGIFPRVVFLGTGSALGTTVRNVSSILLRIDEEHNILLDCGDGTVRQIYTLYGLKKGLEIMSKIKGIFVSHMHADHHSGLIGLLQERAKVTDESPYLIAPAPLFSFLSHYDKVFEPVCGLFKSALSATFSEKNSNNRNLYRTLNVSEIRTGRVHHTALSFGIRLTLPSGFSIAYSGDTRPCDEMVKLAMNVDLLLHEATMGADQVAWAVTTKHSTVPEALAIIKRSEAKHAILTHVSQRYSKAPITPYDTLPKNVGVAYDFMDISMNMLPFMRDVYRGVYALNDPNADKFTMKQLKGIRDCEWLESNRSAL